MKISSRHSFLLILGASVLFGCQKKFVKSPLDEIIKSLPTNSVFSIILHDMEETGNFSRKYLHQYRIILSVSADSLNESITPWKRIGRQVFSQYIKDMGMEIASRDEKGTLSKSVAPPGFNNYVGNSRYGQWREHRGSSFWEFYGRYALLSTMFGTMGMPAHRSYYRDWRTNYSGTNKRYYGPGGNTYGTGSSSSHSSNPKSRWHSKPRRTSFKSRVNSQTRPSSRRSSRHASSRFGGRSYGK